jgi:dihydroxyacetone kinase-like predicted kinase
LLTLYTGEGANQATTKALEAWLGELHPTLDVSVVPGQQPVYPYLVSLE